MLCAGEPDVFAAEMDDAGRDRLFGLIGRTPHLDWLLATRRPRDAGHYFRRRALGRPANAWIGAVIEDGASARDRLPHLAILVLRGWPAFVLYQPAGEAEAVDWRPWLDPDGLGAGLFSWIVCADTGGPDAQTRHDSCCDACRAAGVPFVPMAPSAG